MAKAKIKDNISSSIPIVKDQEETVINEPVKVDPKIDIPKQEVIEKESSIIDLSNIENKIKTLIKRQDHTNELIEDRFNKSEHSIKVENIKIKSNSKYYILGGLTLLLLIAYYKKDWIFEKYLMLTLPKEGN